MFVAAPFVGKSCDRIGYRPLLVTSALILALLAWPAFFLLVSLPGLQTLITVQFLLGITAAVYFVPSYVFCTGAFPAETRTTSVALTFAMSQTVFGGFTPAISSTLLATFHFKTAPAFYVMLTALLSLLALLISSLDDRRRFHSDAGPHFQ
jgi:MFS transporter, MHS family, proline/betaine transporter